ncbi:hypothetical protein REPUB_Repub07fG0044300 [Reevesia pubescens]
MMEEECWSAMVTNLIKINVDTSFHKDVSLARLGVVARDNLVGIIFSASAKHLKASSLLHAEVLAIHWGMKLGEEFGLQTYRWKMTQRLRFKRSSRMTYPYGSLGLSFMISRTCYTFFSHCSFNFTRREGNKLAYLLSKFEDFVNSSRVRRQALLALISNPD